MKSKLISLSNYTQLLTGSLCEEIPLSDIAGDVETELHNLRHMCKETADADRVAQGDAATVSLVSEHRKFNRSGLCLAVGAGLFSAELEASLINRAAGESYDADIEGARVRVTVDGVRRTVVPELSDALIAKQNIEGVNTVEQYRAHTQKRYQDMFREYYLEWYAMQYQEKWFEASVWELDDEDLERWYEAVDRRQKQEQEFHDTTYLESRPGELEEENRKQARMYLQTVLADCFLSGVDPQTAEPKLGSMAELTELTNRVRAPLQKFLSSRFTLVWKEDE